MIFLRLKDEYRKKLVGGRPKAFSPRDEKGALKLASSEKYSKKFYKQLDSKCARKQSAI